MDFKGNYTQFIEMWNYKVLNMESIFKRFKEKYIL